VYDQFLNFISLEPHLFSLGHGGSYVALNDNTMSDEVARANVGRIVTGLFSVFVTMVSV